MIEGNVCFKVLLFILFSTLSTGILLGFLLEQSLAGMSSSGKSYMVLSP